MVLSRPATTADDGIVFRAGGPDGSPRAERAARRCADAMNLAWAFGRSPAKTLRNALELRDQLQRSASVHGFVESLSVASGDKSSAAISLHVRASSAKTS